jgi:competence protein ComEC
MVIFLCLLVLVAAFGRGDFTDILLPLARRANAYCLSMAPQFSGQKVFYQALVCGKSLNFEQSESLRRSSLLHIFVVSGSHLLLLAESLRWLFYLPKPGTRLHRWSVTFAEPIIFFVMLIFCFVTGLQAPAVRAAIQIAVRGFAQRIHLHWNGPTTTLVAGWVCLALNPSWFQSLSFILSWLASMAMAVAQALRVKSVLLTNILIYFWTLVPLAWITFPDPAGILFNVILGPLVGNWLFPLTLVTFFCPPLVPVTDFGLNCFFKLLELFTRERPLPAHAVAIRDIYWLWILISGFHLLIYLYLLKRRGRGRP